MDQFAWTQEETVLRFGLAIAGLGVICIFLYLLIGPLCKRYDERKVLIFLGIFPMILGHVILLPIPGMDHPPISNSSGLTTSSTGFSQQCLAHSHNLSLGVLFEGPMARNIPCQTATTSDPGCALEWCTQMPRLTIPQLFSGAVVNTLGYPFALAITTGIFSKILGPRSQVHHFKQPSF